MAKKTESIVRSWLTEEEYQLLFLAGKVYTLELKKRAIEAPKFLDLMVKVFLTDEKKLCWHAGWVLFNIAETHKDLLEKYLPAIIEKLPEMNYDQQCHGALRVIRYYDITDETLQGILVDVGMDFIRLNKYPANLKYFSIIIIEKIAKYYPEIKKELALTIEEVLPHWTTNYIVQLGKQKLKEYGVN